MTHPAEVIPLKRRPRRVWTRMAIYLLAIVAIWWLVLFFMQDRMLYVAAFDKSGAGANRPVPRLAGSTMLTIDVEGGGRVEGLLALTPSAAAGTRAPLVIFFHGNAEVMDDQVDLIQQYHKLGWSVFVPEFRGYGRSAGRPSQDAIHGDMVRFYDRIARMPEVDASRIVFHGRSLGGGVATDLATARKPAAVVLQSSFTSVSGMAWGFGAIPLLVRNPYHSDRVLSTLGVPVMIFHGSKDGTIPVWHGRKLGQVVPGARYVEFECDHNDFPGTGNERKFWDDIKEFVGKL